MYYIYLKHVNFYTDIPSKILYGTGVYNKKMHSKKLSS